MNDRVITDIDHIIRDVLKDLIKINPLRLFPSLTQIDDDPPTPPNTIKDLDIDLIRGFKNILFPMMNSYIASADSIPNPQPLHENSAVGIVGGAVPIFLILFPEAFVHNSVALIEFNPLALPVVLAPLAHVFF